MAISSLSNDICGTDDTRTATTALLIDYDVVDGSIDYKGDPAKRSSSGGWRSAYFIIGVEVAERFAYLGISCNLIAYLTGPLAQSTATAAENVNTWAGTAALLPLLGAFFADSFLGHYLTIIVASLLYLLALSILILSALLTTVYVSDCQSNKKAESCSPPLYQVALFFSSLYLIAIAQGGHKPCVQAFGADQFDGLHPKESKSKSSFFNWWNFSIFMVIIFTSPVLFYVQDNVNWALGYGIPCIAVLAALVVFLLGNRTYRYTVKGNTKHPLTRIGQVIAKAVRNWRMSPSTINCEDQSHLHRCPEQFKFLNKALLVRDGSAGGQQACSVGDVEETKALFRLFPIWITSLTYSIMVAQYSTFFTKQGAALDRTIFPGFQVPAASLQSFGGMALVLFVPIYDRILVPIARASTKKPSGITMLQRIGIGMALSVLCMVTAAVVETKRLETAKEHGLVDLPKATIPMSFWWLVPQYLLIGVADVFTLIGLQEFFYDQVPMELRSVGVALYLSSQGVGNFLSSFLVSTINKATGGDGRESWFSGNLNRAHVDYFYWLLAGLNTVGFIAFVYFARSYIYTRGRGGSN